MDTSAFTQLAVSHSTSKFYEYETNKAVHRDYVELTGYEKKLFNLGFIGIIDEVIMTRNTSLFSIEQEKFFRQYVLEANTNELSGVMDQFDNFLGTFREV